MFLRIKASNNTVQKSVLLNLLDFLFIKEMSYYVLYSVWKESVSEKKNQWGYF